MVSVLICYFIATLIIITCCEVYPFKHKHGQHISAQIVSQPNNLTKGCVIPGPQSFGRPHQKSVYGGHGTESTAACCDDGDAVIISMSSIRSVGRRRTNNRCLSICAQVICGRPCERIRYGRTHEHACAHMRNSGEWLDLSVASHKPRAQPVSKFMCKLPRSSGSGGSGGNGLTQQMSIERAASQRVPRISTNIVFRSECPKTSKVLNNL